MNPKTFGGAIWLLLFGTASVLLIGAFAQFDSSSQTGGTATEPPAPAPVASPAFASRPAPAPAAASAGVPALPADLSPGLAEIIKLAQAHIGDDTILAYIQNSGQVYNPSADEILYLSDLGVSDKVVAALVNRPEAAPAAAPGAAPMPETPPMPVPANAGMAAAPDSLIEPPPAVVEQPPPLQNPQDSYFYDSLAPYGNWVQTADGWCWQPMVASVDTGWQPYCDRGQWMLTDDGWYWASDYSWGWAPFHYGRWNHDGHFGWVWVPGNVWAPAWVAWRNTAGFAGWAALPPGVLYQPGGGLLAAAGVGGFNASYGLNAASFTFVPQEHFLARNVRRFAAPTARAAALFAGSAPVNNYSFAGGRIINAGVSAEQIAAATKTVVPKYTMTEAHSPETSGGRGAGQSLAVFRPDVTGPVVRSSAGAPTRSILINKTPRPAAPEPAMARGSSPRLSSVAADGSVQDSRYTASPARSGFVGGYFEPPPSARPGASSVAVSVPAPPASPAPGWSPFIGPGDSRRPLTPSTPAPAAGYPSFNPRGFSPAPPVAPDGPFRNAPQHNAPVGSGQAGSEPAAAPVDNHGGGGAGAGGGQGGKGSGPASSSSAPPGSTKPSR